ncbi:MAG: riboflavin biosynthesis protein RibF [Tannerellaceae bacterium]|jgi:riboflavin kinase/FMN adenylyltransferase|nr:riboflavin biosynthesis protein RibF [Tannerellaceae bacterium]
MIVINGLNEIREGVPLAVTTGFFDGVHVGHRFMLNELQRIAGERGLASAVVTFTSHPRRVLQTDFQPALLTSFEEKMMRMAETPVQYCIVLDFTAELAAITAQEYIINVLAGQCGARLLLVGHDHRFGRNRSEGLDEYRQYGASCGVEIVVAGRYAEEGVTVSSSSIRRLLGDGKVEQAARLLTYNYRLAGRVVAGHQIGRSLGFPTVNLALEDEFKMLPRTGVYAARAWLGGRAYAGMLYVGYRPTFNGTDGKVTEVHLIDFSGDAYGKDVIVELVGFVRDDVRFASVDELKAQLDMDREMILKLLGNGE